jgi:hypothetical protein
MDDLTSLIDAVGKLNEKVDKALATPAVNTKAVVPDHPPAIRKGESVLSSRPFRFTNFIGSLLGPDFIDADKAKLEIGLSKGFRNALEKTGQLHSGAGAGAMYPVAKSFLKDETADTPEARELFNAIANGFEQEVDVDEIKWIARKSFSPSVKKTAMSYLDDTIGGSLVAPAEQGELIPLIRNASAVDRAGAKQVPLPAQGKWVAPRITGPSTGYWITENTAISESNPTTGMVSMQAKKLGVLIRVPNELFKFASAASDAMLREDIAKTLALGYDYACLYGTGSGQPKGLINYTGTNELIDYATTTPAPSGVDTNGNNVYPEDGYMMAALVEDRSFDVDGFKWIMRGKMKGTVVSYRTGAAAATDQAGPFAQDLTRALGFRAPPNWCGYDIVTSSQVRNTVTKGNRSNNSEIFGGVWNNLIQGIYGAMEFATATQGDTMFAADQSMIRGILYCDSVLRYPGSFVWYKEVIQSNVEES